jgi:hypothetical protein
VRKVLALLAISGGAFAQSYDRVQGWCEQGGAKVSIVGMHSSGFVQASYPQCTVTAYLHSGGLASIYDTSAGHPLGNPYSSDSTGHWSFYAADGHYDVVLSGGGIPSPISIYDIPIHAIGGLSNPMTNAGDLIVGGTGGTPTRLATPGNGTFCPSWSSGVLSWITCPGAGGGISSVGLTMPSWLRVTTSPLTANGTLAVDAATGQTSHQVIGTCGSATSFGACALQAADLPALTRTFLYVWQGVVQAGVIGFAVNLPTTNAPTPYSLGGTDPVAVLEWPTAQSTYYAYGDFKLPTGYVSNSAISYSLDSQCNTASTCDSAHAAILTPYWGCTSTATPNAPSWTGITPVNITNAAAGDVTTTTGTITPTCAAGNRAYIKLKVDTNTNSLTGPFDLISATFSVQGGM